MSPDIHRHRILILDFGSQYTQLIARRVREIGVYSEIHGWDVTDKDITDFNASGIILSGGPESVTAQDSPRAPQIVFDLGLPVLGICYGMPTMAEQMGGSVQGSDTWSLAMLKSEARLKTDYFLELQIALMLWGGRYWTYG